ITRRDVRHVRTDGVHNAPAFMAEAARLARIGHPFQACPRLEVRGAYAAAFEPDAYFAQPGFGALLLLNLYFTGRSQHRRAHQLGRGHGLYSWPAMKASTSAWASSSVICTGGCLQNHAAGASIGPARPRSLAILAQRIMSMATPAEFGLSSTERRSSRFIGTPPKSRPSMRRKQTLLSFC